MKSRESSPSEPSTPLGSVVSQGHLGGASRIEAQPLDDDRLQVVQDFLFSHTASSKGIIASVQASRVD